MDTYKLREKSLDQLRAMEARKKKAIEKRRSAGKCVYKLGAELCSIQDAIAYMAYLYNN